ncbi:hypothetical protein BJ742DRAFT_786868 [Cladochytrium replicatum]|nr:hypothetical protein BJ742DRAFT_786868 [Cladochytrium replicatum]
MRVTDLIDHAQPQPREPQLTPPLTPRRVNAELIHLPSLLAVPAANLQSQPLQMMHYPTQVVYNTPLSTDGPTDASHHGFPSFLLPPPGDNSMRASTDLESYHQDNMYGSPSLSHSSRESPSFAESDHSPYFHADGRMPSHLPRASPHWVDHSFTSDLHMHKNHAHVHLHHTSHLSHQHRAHQPTFRNAQIKVQHSPPHTAPSSPPTSYTTEPPRPFHCTYCSSSFKRRQTLDEHIASKHLDLRAHPCDVPGCGASFHRRQDKLRHFRSCHAGDELRVFMCKGCHRTFARLDSLRKHLRTRKGKTQCVPAMEEKGEECV